MLALPCPTTTTASIRPARWSDLTPLSRVRTRSWQHAYEGILPAHALARITPGRSRAILVQSLAVGDDSRGILVAESDRGELLGYASFGPRTRQGVAVGGEVFEVYLDPGREGHGIGKRLFTSAVWELVNRRLSPVVVRALARNPARQFYESLGASYVGRQQQRFGGRDVSVMVYAFKDTLPLPPLG